MNLYGNEIYKMVNQIESQIGEMERRLRKPNRNKIKISFSSKQRI